MYIVKLKRLDRTRMEDEGKDCGHLSEVDKSTNSNGLKSSEKMRPDEYFLPFNRRYIREIY